MSIDELIGYLQELRKEIGGDCEVVAEYDFEGEVGYFTGITELFKTTIVGEDENIIVLMLDLDDDEENSDGDVFDLSNRLN